MITPFIRRYFFSLTIISVFSLMACNSQQPENSTVTQPQESKSDEITIKRYEKALFSLDDKNLRSGMATLYPEYSFFMGNEWQDTLNILRIYNFINDPNIKELYALTIKKYPDVKYLEKEITQAFGRYRKAYPEKPIPQVFTYVSGLDIENPVYFYDTAMAVGLDLFLGSDVEAYQKAGLPKYKIERFTPDHLLSQCMMAVSDQLVRIDEKHNTLLDQMIAAGKALYFLDVTLPEINDEYKIGYTAEQLTWSRENESEIWAFIIEHQLLFSSDPQGISKMMTDAPFTSGFAASSPGRLGAYMGWQIVRKYMKEAGDVSLKQLMENTDAQEILKVSGFKPGK